MSLHIVGCLACPASLFCLLQGCSCLHSCLGQPARGALQSSAGWPPGYRNSKEILENVPDGKQWQLWIPSRPRKRSSADTVISSEGLEKREKNVTNISPIFSQSEVNRLRKEHIFHRDVSEHVGRVLESWPWWSEESPGQESRGLNCSPVWAPPQVSPPAGSLSSSSSQGRRVPASAGSPKDKGDWLVQIACKGGICWTYVKFH